MISDDDMRVQLSLIKLGVVTDAELGYLMTKVLWLNKYVVWRNTFTSDKPVLTITEDGEKFLSS
jgi:hypothetical protein